MFENYGKNRESYGFSNANDFRTRMKTQLTLPFNCPRCNVPITDKTELIAFEGYGGAPILEHNGSGCTFTLNEIPMANQTSLEDVFEGGTDE